VRRRVVASRKGCTDVEVTTIELKDAPFRMCLVPKDLWTFRNSIRGVAVGRAGFGEEMEAGEGTKVEVEV